MGSVNAANYVIDSLDDICDVRSTTDKSARVFWEITRQCNLRCVHCQVWPRRELRGVHELSTEHCLAVIDSLSAARIGILKITGGEPFCRGDILAILRHASLRGVRVDVTTNATLLGREMIPKVRELIGHASISIDAVSPSVLRSLRTPLDTSTRAATNAALLIDAGVAVHVNFVLMKLNIAELGAVARWADRMGAASLNIIGLDKEGKAARCWDRLQCDEAQIREVAHEVRHLRDTLRIKIRTVRLSGMKVLPRCSAAATVWSIDAYGYVHPCLAWKVARSEANSLRARSWESVTAWPHFTQLQQSIDAASVCPSCPNRQVCGKGCRGAAVAAALPGLPDPLCQSGIMEAHNVAPR
jgi:radical SAM protein with 4Fe4S-binding SPASM domain